MNKWKKIIRNLVYPVTLLTAVAIYAIYLSVQSLIIAFNNDHTAAIYAAVVIPITLFILVLYTIERLLIKKIAYFKLLLIEIVVATIIFLYTVSKI